MTARDPNEARKIIPRWHSLAASSKQGEIGPTHRVSADPSFSDKEREASLAEHLGHWSENSTLTFAEDFVSAALVLGANDEAREAAELVLASPEASTLATTLARRLLSPDAIGADLDEFDPFNVEELRRQVARLKGRLRNDPRAALSWAEIARTYAALGQSAKASGAMEIALSMSPTDRFLLRSAARLHLHLGEPDRAHRLLTSSARLRSDPWLLSAEIAIAPLAGRQSRNQGHARRVLESQRFLPHATSELASALGTEALAAGDRRGVRRLLAASLLDPTENAVAQAEWVSRQERTFEFDRTWLRVEDSFEARAHFYAREREEMQAIENAGAWLREQPFAKEPAIFGSYRGALVRDYETSIRFARVGLQANPADYMLRNNLVFALASAGRIEEARAELDVQEEQTRGKTLEDEWGFVVEATRGLVAFREGDLSGGRAAYLAVIRDAHDPSLQTLATILWAREESVAGTSEAERAVRMARDFVAASDARSGPQIDDLPAWLEHIPE